MRCGYCHNPDTWELGVGESKSSDELIEDIVRYNRYIDGVTISGGEPLMQIDFVIDLFKKLRKKGLSTCLDTSGILFDKSNVSFVDKIDELLEFCDLVILDIKHIDDNQHKTLTGHSNQNVLDFAQYLDSKNIDLWLRYVLVPTVNDSEDVIYRWKDFSDKLNNVRKIEVLPYHRLGIDKYKKMGIDYKFKDIPEPSYELLNKVKKLLEKGDI